MALANKNEVTCSFINVLLISLSISHWRALQEKQGGGGGTKRRFKQQEQALAVRRLMPSHQEPVCSRGTLKVV